MMTILKCFLQIICCVFELEMLCICLKHMKGHLFPTVLFCLGSCVAWEGPYCFLSVRHMCVTLPMYIFYMIKINVIILREDFIRMAADILVTQFLNNDTRGSYCFSHDFCHFYFCFIILTGLLGNFSGATVRNTIWPIRALIGYDVSCNIVLKR